MRVCVCVQECEEDRENKDEEEEDGKGQEGNRMKGRVEEEKRWIGSRESEEEERNVKGQ